VGGRVAEACWAGTRKSYQHHAARPLQLGRWIVLAVPGDRSLLGPFAFARCRAICCHGQVVRARSLRSDYTWIRHIVGHQRHVDDEDAAFTRYVPSVDVAFVSPDRLASNRQSETQSRSF
jgi:hypothetical protein